MKKQFLALAALTLALSANAGTIEQVQRDLPAGKWTGKNTYGKIKDCTFEIQYPGDNKIVATLNYFSYKGKPVEDVQIFDFNTPDTGAEVEYSDSIDIYKSRVIHKDGDYEVRSGESVSVYFDPEVSSVKFGYMEWDGESDPHDSFVSCADLVRVN